MTAAAAAPTGRLDRAGREALRFAREARRLARRHARALGPAREELDAAAEAVETAVEKGKPERLLWSDETVRALLVSRLLAGDNSSEEAASP